MTTRLILLLAAGTAALAALFAAAIPLAGRFLDEALDRYPGSGLITVDELHFADLKRGWITRQAIYQTNADLTTTLQWYTDLLPGARTRFAGDCVTVSERQGILRSERTISILLCARPPGTRILVGEEVYLSP
jgi:hypothetical protein